MTVKEKGLFQKTLSLAKALLTGETVDEVTLRKRLEVCTKCYYSRKNHRQEMKCGICGCRIRGDKALINLARFVETSDYGCRHKEGSQWKKNGC